VERLERGGTNTNDLRSGRPLNGTCFEVRVQVSHRMWGKQKISINKIASEALIVEINNHVS
jgi:hypothetical protein